MLATLSSAKSNACLIDLILSILVTNGFDRTRYIPSRERWYTPTSKDLPVGVGFSEIAIAVGATCGILV